MFMNDRDPRAAKEQIDENYQHGGGWSPMQGWKLGPTTLRLTYGSGDEAEHYDPLAKTTLRDETIVYYHSSWVAIVQKDGTFEVSRVD
jgi:hypothetical protein